MKVLRHLLLLAVFLTQNLAAQTITLSEAVDMQLLSEQEIQERANAFDTLSSEEKVEQIKAFSNGIDLLRNSLNDPEIYKDGYLHINKALLFIGSISGTLATPFIGGLAISLSEYHEYKKGGVYHGLADDWKKTSLKLGTPALVLAAISIYFINESLTEYKVEVSESDIELIKTRLENLEQVTSELLDIYKEGLELESY